MKQAGPSTYTYPHQHQYQHPHQHQHQAELNGKLLLKGTKRLKKRLNKKRLNRELRQTELPGVTPELKAAVKKFRADGMQPKRD